MAANRSDLQAPPVNWRAVALPAEHGSWSLVLEPILLGLLVAPSWPGFGVALAGFFAFLAQRPFKIALTDRQRGKVYARTRLARRVLGLYVLTAVFALALAVWFGGPRLLWPLLPAVPIFLLYVYFDRRPGRHLEAELAAPAAFAAISAMIPLAADWPMDLSLALWAAMSARSLPAVLYIRARLRLAKGKEVPALPTIAAHVLALLAALALIGAGLLPPLAAAAFVILLLRAGIGLSPWRLQVRTQTLGWLEVFFGFLTVILIAAGYWLE